MLQRPSINPTTQASEILLLRRAQTGFMDGFWTLPGGHVEPGELPMAAAQRECQEETGVSVSRPQPICVLPYSSKSGSKRGSKRRDLVHVGLNLVFFAHQWRQQPYLAEPQMADMLCWVPTTSLPKPCVPWLASVLQLGQQGQWYEELSYEKQG